MTAKPKPDPQRAQRRLDSLKRKLTLQAADVANKSEMPATAVARVYLEVAVGVALLAGVPPHEVVSELRARADLVEKEAGGAMASRN